MATKLEGLTSWEDKGAWARAQRDISLAQVQPALEGLPQVLPLNSQGLPKIVLTSREVELTENFTISELLVKLRSREFSAEEVTRAFLRRAALAQFSV